MITWLTMMAIFQFALIVLIGTVATAILWYVTKDPSDEPILTPEELKLQPIPDWIPPKTDTAQ